MRKKVDNEFSGRFYTFPDKVHAAQGVSDATTHPQQGGEDEESDDSEKVGPAMLVLPSRPSREELYDIVAATKNGFSLTGSVAKAEFGPSIGLVDIGECKKYYLFRVSLPGVNRDESKCLLLC